MSTTTSILINVIQTPGNKGTTRAHTQFRNLIRKIDRQKHNLAEWNETLPQYHQKVAVDYEPLWNRFNTHRVELLQLFDRIREQTKLKRQESNKLEHLIRSISGELIAEHGYDDLKPLYNKYSTVDFDTEAQADEAAAADAVKSMMEAMMGPDFFDDDEAMGNLEEMSRTVEEKLQQIQEEAEEKKRQAEARRATRPKSARQQEKEARQQAEARNISKSIQEIYRKLVTAMHPDREPDPAERERKTELMQQVNVAYEKNDLLQLLELQLALEQIDPAHITSLADDRLKYYNKILKRQSEQLQQEIIDIEYGMKLQLGLPSFASLSPKQLIDRLNADIRNVKSHIAILREDLKAFQDEATLKAWLKGYKIPAKDPLEGLFF